MASPREVDRNADDWEVTNTYTSTQSKFPLFVGNRQKGGNVRSVTIPILACLIMGSAMAAAVVLLLKQFV